MNHALIAFDFNISFWSFRVVSHSNIDKSDHFTISKLGVTHINNGEAEFTPLNQWEKELHHYSQLIKIKTFANFRMWKAFYVWKKNVRGKYVNILWMFCVNFLRCILEQWMEFKSFLSYIGLLSNEIKWCGCNRESDSIYRIL